MLTVVPILTLVINMKTSCLPLDALDQATNATSPAPSTDAPSTGVVVATSVSVSVFVGVLVAAVPTAENSTAKARIESFNRME